MIARRINALLAVALLTGLAASAALAQRGVQPRGQLIQRPADEVFTYFEEARFDQSVPEPEAVIGHELGERFTRYGQIVRYLEEAARSSPRALFRQYGWSHQRRPLFIMTISSPENLDRLDSILAQNRALADPRTTSDADARRIIDSNPAISWLSFNVHGNEASCSEAALAVIHTLLGATSPRIESILENSVVVIDPCLNPDGRERYVSWYENVVGRQPNENPDATEHDEPWPGGRTNHYLFDLNRDWLWLVHPESRSRLGVYREYLPHYHGDFHEQGYRSPYFFGPGATPYNQNIPDATVEWLDIYGSACAAVFDGRGLVYSTKERFDYLYPGYGKVLPCYQGAVGLLYEQAGHGRAGLAIEVSDRYTLTLRERTHHHYLTALASIETTADRRAEQLRRFRQFFEDSMELPDDAVHAYIISSRNDPMLLDRVWKLCSAQGIEVLAMDSATELGELHEFRDGEPLEPLVVPAGSWVIPTDQPMGRLVRATFERSPEIEDPDTYDITSWSLPVLFGLDAWASTAPVSAGTRPLEEWSAPEGELTGSGDTAIIIDASQHAFPRAAGAAIRRGLFTRFTGEPVRIDGRSFARGSLIAHTIRNDVEELNAFIGEALGAGVDVHRVRSGLTEQGHVLGANEHEIYDNPKALLVRGSPFSSYSFGQHWHLLDVDSPIPHTVVNADALGSLDLHEYNVLVLPGAWASPARIAESLGERTHDPIVEWVRQGGTIVATHAAARWATEQVLGIDPDDEETGAPEPPEGAGEDAEQRTPLSQMTYEERDQRNVEDRVPGPLLSASVDTTHPLAAGVREWVGMIKLDDRTLPVEETGHVVARYDDEPHIGGSISERNLDKIGGTPLMSVHRHGAGHVICINDDPTMRGLNHAAMRLLLNAIIYGPSL